MTILLPLTIGFIMLVAGGELLVRGAVRFAERLGMSPLLIGLTLVGFGTSTPELVTSVQAALNGSSGIAVGNIVGSNIANILLILGLAALLSPIPVGPSALRRDGVLVLFTAVAFAAMAWLWTLDRTVGVLLVLGLVAYLVHAYRQESRSAKPDHTAAYEKGEALEELLPHQQRKHARSKAVDITLSLALALVGLVLVIFGGKYFVSGSIALARSFSISEAVIGLTIVAIGTSMPELVTSVVAAYRKHSDVALGNVLGSNLYNVLGIGGLTGIIAPTDFPAQIVRFDNLVMIAASALLLFFAWTGQRISRREGGILLTGYVLYLAFLLR
jgi:cation:H+ antiporter